MDRRAAIQEQSARQSRKSVRRKDVHRHTLASLLVTGTLAVVAGCAGLESQPAPSATQALSAEVDARQADRQILVTVDLKGSWRPPRARSGGGGYVGGYRVSARTRRVVSDLAKAYDLREVSSWPITLLGVHCVVFELPPASAAKEVVSLLAGDARV